jgi:hypothetical protein
MKHPRVLFFLLFLWGEACILIHSYDSIELGGHYQYIYDPPAIIYNKDSKFKGEGVIVVDPIVKTYRLYDRYIIAKSCDNCDDSISFIYWIIDKNTGIDTATPTKDVVAFEKRLKELKINLKIDE